MTIVIAHEIGPSKIDIAYERLGPAGGPPVLLVMGGGAQLVNWPDGLCDALIAHGLQLVRFDNRDAGESTHVRDAPEPDFAAALAGDTSSAAYTLSDMAADTAGLLDHLGLASAHVVGSSLGGFVGQILAVEHRKRVRSLTCISSTTGDPRVGLPAPETLARLRRPPARDRAEYAEQVLATFRVIGSPAYELDVEAICSRAAQAYDRGYDPGGLMRQALATLATGDRTARLRNITAPALVIHGDADAMCDVSGGRAIAGAISCARLVVLEGMGHDLPRALWPRLADEIVRHVALAEKITQRAGQATM